ncbi:MAG: septum formation initiator family protein [Pseudomonadales bacterium]|nr:septum formation initiator family protein [Pseudomonadales bacterium]
MMAKIGIGLLVLSTLWLQYKAWFSDVGHFAARELEAEVLRQQQRSAQLEERNRILAAEVMGLKNGLGAVEARARTDLGMIKEGETFYLVSDRR